MTKIEVPTEIAKEVAAQAGPNGNNPRPSGRSRGGKRGEERAKRLDSLVDGVTRNLFEALSEAKRRQDYDLFLRVTDRLIRVAELEDNKLEESGRALRKPSNEGKESDA